MVSVPGELTQPLAVIDSLFSQCIATGKGPAPEWGEQDHFKRILCLDDEESFAKIPCINDIEMAATVPPFTLVRYRCLVQDIFEPEIYAAFFEEHDANAGAGSTPAPARILTSKYRECVEPAPGKRLEDLGAAGMQQRGVCYCVPIPGESLWAREAALSFARASGAVWCNQATSGTASSKPLKRGRDEDVDMSMSAPEGQKLRSETSEPQTGNVDTPSSTAKGASCISSNDSSGPGPRSADEFGLNFPLPWEERPGHGQATACIVKLYDDDAESLRLCETVEILGILCINPELADFDATPLAESGLDRDGRRPSTSLVPRLHALHIRRMPYYHPLVPYSSSWLTEARLATAWQRHFAAEATMAAARGAAIQQLARHLGGDMLAAEYMLMLLISRAFGKVGELNLGHLSLNLTRWPNGASVQSLADAVAELMPRSVLFKLTADSLNKSRWKPRKDFVVNRLVASQLQVAAGTVILVDETGMAEGQLSTDGVKGLTALGTLALTQQLACDFSSYDVNIPVEAACMFVSEGKSIIRDVAVRIPLQPSAPLLTEAMPSPPGSLEATRLFLALLTRIPKALHIPDAIAHRFSEDFAAARQEFGVPSELCHSWMNLARACSLSHGESELKAEHWQFVLKLENERLRRCREQGILER